MKKKIVFALVLVAAFVALTGGAEASYWIGGTVHNATDGTPADGHTALVYLLGDEGNGVQGTIGQTLPNKYVIDAELIPGYAAQVDDVLYVKVIDTGDGYTAGPVSVTISGVGADEAPDMTLQIPPPPIVSDPEAIPGEIVVNTEFTELRVRVTTTYFDIDTVTINLTPIGGMWVPMNGSTYRFTMYAMTNLTADTTVYNCTTNASVIGNFSLTVNATDTKGSSNTSISIPLTVTEEQAVTLDYILVKKAGSTGRNWISIPLTNEITNASSLMAAIGGSCTTVNRWNPDNQTSEGWLSMFGGIGDDFDIVPGEGYEVWVDADTTFNLTGEPVDIGQIDLIKKAGSTGRNWIGLPYDTTMANASSLMAAIGGSCTTVNRWDPDNQTSEGWLSMFGGIGDDFDIVPGEGYEVWVDSTTIWVPV
ncbi:MAG: hypothetical protein JW878_09990 [Methanomicrobia archaeon]|nr:hypothetical protein [Methanomicrobia archaeon]